MSRLNYVDTPAALDESIAIFDTAPSLNVDTEFLRERTYFAQLCLVQVGIADTAWLFDPQRLDLAPLWDLLDTKLLVFHAARQDLEIFGQTAAHLPSSVMDTQIMAGLAGFAPQIGYASLVEKLTGVQLDKSKTRTDWSRRPLDDDELAYAAADVTHLGTIYQQLTDTLTDLGRLDWAREDSGALLKPSLYDNDATLAWQRVKGLSRLPPKARAVAVALAEWREETAVARNLPRQWVLKDAEVLALADSYVRGDQDLAGFDNRSSERRHRKTVQSYLAGRADSMPEVPEPRERPDAKTRDDVKRLSRRVNAIAEELGIEAEVLVSMRELRAVVAGENGGRLFSGWRGDVVGAAVREEIDRLAIDVAG